MIAERKLKLLAKGRGTKELTVRLGKPERTLGRDEFSCQIDIVGPDGVETTRVFGLDSFQALELSLRYIPTALHRLRQESGWAIYWLDEGDDMGFPVNWPFAHKVDTDANA